MGDTMKFLDLTTVQKARKSLNADGYFIIEGGYPRDYCQSICRFIDAYPQNAAQEVNYAATELRIWDAQEKSSAVKDFYQDCNVFMSCLRKADCEAFTLLAIRNRHLDQQDALLVQDRWHIDSFRKQLKIFLFLTDTTEASGPFEFLPGTHRFTFKRRMLRVYFKLSDLMSAKRRSYAKLQDRVAENLGEQGYLPLPVICQAGTVLIVNTSAIHRARPCYQGSRYALTAYYK